MRLIMDARVKPGIEKSQGVAPRLNNHCRAWHGNPRRRENLGRKEFTRCVHHGCPGRRAMNFEWRCTALQQVIAGLGPASVTQILIRHCRAGPAIHEARDKSRPGVYALRLIMDARVKPGHNFEGVAPRFNK